MKTQLSICPINYKSVVDQKRFGVVTENDCHFELWALSGSKDTVAKDANAFYELFIKDKNDQLQSVPVLVSNFRDIDGEKPNLELDK